MEKKYWGFIIGKEYNRQEIAKSLGYKSFEAISRGVVTPRGAKTIILFVTKEKQKTAIQYKDNIIGNELIWEGESSHFNDERIINANVNGEIIILFFRNKFNEPFNFLGQISLTYHETNLNKPSEYRFQILD